MRAALAMMCALGGFVVAAPEPAPAPRPVVGREWSNPPPEIAALLKQVQKGTLAERNAAHRALVKLPEAEPYLRFATLFTPDDRWLESAHEELLIGIDRRNVERAKKWGEAGRIDLLVEAVCLAYSDDRADEITAHLHDFARKASDRAGELLTGKKDGFTRLGPSGKFTAFASAARYEKKQKPFTPPPTVCRYAGERVHLNKDRAARLSLIRAGELSSEGGMSSSIAVVRDKWTGAGQFTKFFSVLMFANCDVALGDLDGCLVVTDGDVTRWELVKDVGVDSSDSVVIAWGSVTGHPGAGSRRTVVWAGDNITLRKSDSIKGWALLAGGEIRAEATKGREPAVVKSKTKENPFGVRFFETADVGVEVEAVAGGVRIKSLSSDSPLAAQGLCVGDTIVRVNDTRTDSVKEFRRELRRSVVWEAGVFWLQGDGKRQTRVVRFPDGLPGR